MHRSLAAALLLLNAAGAIAESFAFAVLGDAPYNREERIQVERLLEGMAKEPLAFAVHIGDIKSGHSECSDATFADRLQLLDGSSVPLVYTPGDNDWTDCDRRWAGRYDPEERLAKLRQLFFAESESLGRRRIALDSQAAAPGVCCVENRRWWHSGVVFVTLHVVGSANNRGTGSEPNMEFVARTAANLEWLRNSFALARERSAPGLALFIHADPGIERVDPFRRGYAEVLGALREEAIAFARPVLIVHGDTHRFQLDRPWHRRGVANLLRLETPGSPTVAWVPVRVDPASADIFEVGPPRTVRIAPR